MKAKIAQKLYGLASYYKETLTENQVKMYVEDILSSGIGEEKLAQAILLYRQDGKNTFFPLPAKLITLVTPEESSDLDIGREATGRIIQAVSKFGFYRLQDAKEFIGSLGWKVVERQGGWGSLCTNLNSENKGTLQAQMRDSAVSILKLSRNGTLDKPIDLPQLEQKSNMQSLGELTKQITENLKGEKNES